jgi:O-antigen/teichoic acid export membrane protein
VYWVLAARLYPADVVGAAAGAISAMLFVTSLGWLGLQFVLIRFVPVAGDRAGRLIAGTYGAAAVAGLVAGIVFLVAFARTAELGYLASGLAAGAAFLAGGVAWVVFSLQDPALIGLRRSGWVPIENAAFGSLKAIVLVAGAATGSAWAIFGSWVGSAAIFAVVINVLIFRKVLPRAAGGASGTLPDRRGLMRFAAGQHAVAVLAAVPDTLVPLLVLAFLGASSNAHYYAAWTISFSLRLLAVNIANALLSEAARAEDDLPALLRSAVRLAAGLLLPLSLIALAGASLIIAVFGSGYDEATGLLRIFAISLLPFGVVTGVLTIERVRRRTALALIVVAVSTGATISADALLIPELGVSGAGWGWLIGQVLAAATGVLLMLRRAGAAGAATR